MPAGGVPYPPLVLRIAPWQFSRPRFPTRAAALFQHPPDIEGLSAPDRALSSIAVALIDFCLVLLLLAGMRVVAVRAGLADRFSPLFILLTLVTAVGTGSGSRR
jgi:hypothetical protein